MKEEGDLNPTTEPNNREEETEQGDLNPTTEPNNREEETEQGDINRNPGKSEE